MKFEKIKQIFRQVFSRAHRTSPDGRFVDIALLELYCHFIKPGQLCFDVGANIGERTDLWLQLGAKVVCIEPQPQCAEILQAKYQNNPNVEILPIGLASKPGEMTLSICSAAKTLSTFSEKWKTGRFKDYSWDIQHAVSMSTLDELIGRYGVPSFCKIDVEGFELDVIQGLSQPIGCLSFEFTHEFLDDAEKCIQHLTFLGQAEFNFVAGDNLDTRFQFGFDDWVEGCALVERLKMVSFNSFWGDVYARFVE